jgi:hypothetical protein
MVLRHFSISIVRDSTNWLLLLKNNARSGFLGHGTKGKAFLGLRDEKFGPP